MTEEYRDPKDMTDKELISQWAFFEEHPKADCF